MSATVAAARPGLVSRLWAGYLRQLSTRPLRTKMITSGGMFLLGDGIAQFGIEGRRIGADGEEPLHDEPVPDGVVLPYRVSLGWGHATTPLLVEVGEGGNNGGAEGSTRRRRWWRGKRPARVRL